MILDIKSTFSQLVLCLRVMFRTGFIFIKFDTLGFCTFFVDADHLFKAQIV
jgi:hypothetical protein